MTALALISTRHEYNSLAAIYLPIAAAVFLIVVLAVAATVIRYRRRSVPAQFSENNLLEGTYAVVLAAIVGFLLYLTYSAEHRVDTVSAHETPAVTVNVLAAKWEWQFNYPRYGITQRSGAVGEQPLVLPAGQAIRFNLASVDVIHAFWVPQIDFKWDAIPGSIQSKTLTFEHPGLYPGQCAEFCGLRHPEMIFNVRVVSPAAFARWARSHGRGAP